MSMQEQANPIENTMTVLGPTPTAEPTAEPTALPEETPLPAEPEIAAVRTVVQETEVIDAEQAQPAGGTLVLLTLLLAVLLAATAVCARRLWKVSALLRDNEGAAQENHASGKDGK